MATCEGMMDRDLMISHEIRQADSFTFAARRYCDEYALPAERLPVVEVWLRHRAFMEAIQPYLRIKARVALGAMPPMVIHPNGLAERLGDGLNDEQRKTLVRIDGLIESVAEQHGLPLTSTAPPATPAS